MVRQLAQATSPMYETLEALVVYAKRRFVASNLAQQ